MQRNSETESDYGSDGSIFKTPDMSPGDDCYTSIANFNSETESNYGSEGSILKTPDMSPGDD